jgi:hypothetical protein
MNRLTGAQIGELHRAMLDAFDMNALDDLLVSRLHRRLDRFTSLSADGRTAVLDLIMAAEREGWTPDLLRAVAAEDPTLQKLTDELLVSLTSRQIPAATLVWPERPVEKMKASGFQRFLAFAKRLTQPKLAANPPAQPLRVESRPRLTGPQGQLLRNAIVSAFHAPELEHEILPQLGPGFSTRINHQVSLDMFVFEVIQEAERLGSIGELLKAVAAARPDDAEIQAVVAALLPQVEQLPSSRPGDGATASGTAKLTGPQFRQLQDAMLATFDGQSLRELLLFELNMEVDLIAFPQPPEYQMREVIMAAERGDWLDDLLRAAIRARPDARQLEAAVANLATNLEEDHQQESSFKIRFDPEEIGRIERAILSCFSLEELEHKVLAGRLKRKQEHITFSAVPVEAVRDIVSTAERDGWMGDLLLAMAQERPRRRDIQSLVEELSLGISAPSLSHLDPEQRARLQNAMLDAFPRKRDLENLLLFHFGVHLLSDVTPANNLLDATRDVIGTAESHGWIEDLIRAVAEEQPERQDIQSLAAILIDHLHSAEPPSHGSP